MAQLLPLAAASAVPATAGATALASGAALAGGTSLATGVAAGTALGTGATMAAMPALSYAGANLAAPGLLGALPAAAAPGIFSAATPALAGLPSLASTATPLATASKSLMMANAPLYGGEAFKSLSMANAPLYGGEAAKLTNLGFQSAQLPSNFIKVADTATKTGLDTSLLGQGAKFKAAPSLSRTDLLARQAGQVPKTVEAANLAQQADVGQRAIDLARAQKMAAQSGVVSPIIEGENFLTNFGNLIQNPSMKGAIDYAKEHPYATAAAGYGLYSLMKPKYKPPETSKGTMRPYELAVTNLSGEPYSGSAEREQLRYDFTPLEPYSAAEGGIAKAYAIGGPVETMAAMNAVGANTGYPMAGINTPMYSNPMVQRPEAVNVISPSGDAGVSAYSGEPRFAGGGLSDLGGYSDGGRLLKGPGDGVSDSIPAVIGNKQPARLADGEFVVPARIVSELGNGSTEAGARKLYAMMDRVQKARGNTVGKKKVAINTKADKYLPA